MQVYIRPIPSERRSSNNKPEWLEVQCELPGSGSTIIPPLFCVYVYWYALNGWFQDDDFVWLGLLRSVYCARDLFLALFRPTIHGTWRPWSDRAFFLAFRALFGPEALPYHIWIFLTKPANLALLSHIARRLTGLRVAGLLRAAVLDRKFRHRDGNIFGLPLQRHPL